MEFLAGTTLAVDIEPGSAGLSDRGEGWVRPGRDREAVRADVVVVVVG